MIDGERAGRRPLWRRIFRGCAVATGAYLLAVLSGCFNPSLPTDLILNLPRSEHFDELEANPEEPTLVILQHGFWRSWGALWRLQRALEDHGYEVLNRSYPSTQGTIEEHAALLEKHLEEYLKERGGDLPRLCFVGHSMGGLVIRSYLQRPGARQADTCLFLGTPQRGAALVDKSKERWYFPLLMGRKAVLQLSPSDPFYASLLPLKCRSIGSIIGGQADGEGLNDDIPGDDDGTVAVEEAHLPEETDSILLKTGHTRLSFTAEPIRQVLWFLRRRSFERTGQ